MMGLLELAYDAHGRLERWQQLTQVRFTGSAGGILPWPRPDTTDYRTFDGFAFPTRRYVLRRESDNTTSGGQLITLNIHSVTLT
ncbi:hypothetical protein ACQPZQ_17040 [Pseudonocardia sp. CA-142604]|uniref:hypothetical protein n=1 Tax=Pseudonocardia sp. CA-142604 TaxID=3240024 RepID=UPI003D8CA0A9